MWVSIAGGQDHFSLLTTHIYSDSVNKGETYQLRYRAWNVNGAGLWSEDGWILAAQVPSRPLTPVYVESDLTSISLGFTASADDGGLIISQYVLQLSPMLTTNWLEVTTYDYISLYHTVTVANDPILANQKYRFRIKAVNAYGSSEWSPTIDLVVAPLPSAPSAPTKVQSLSSQNSIYLQWADPVSDTEIITGFRLYMLDLQGGDNLMIYDGYNNPNLMRFHVEDLSPGHSYAFTVVAFNFNGNGPASEAVTYKACTAPSGQSVPVVWGTTATSISFRWVPPTDTGACPILSYELYLDDGQGGSFVSTDAEVIGSKSYLREHTVSFDASKSGLTFRFKIKSLNEIGEAESVINSQLLA